MGRYREALECSEKSLAINPDNVPARLNKEQALQFLKTSP